MCGDVPAQVSALLLAPDLQSRPGNIHMDRLNGTSSVGPARTQPQSPKAQALAGLPAGRRYLLGGVENHLL